MMKWIMYGVFAVLVAGSWMMYSKSGDGITKLTQQIDAQEELGDPDGEVAKLKSDRHSMESSNTFNGILLTFLSAGLVGIFVVVHLLPFFAQRITHAVFDSGEIVEKDVMHDARSLVAQGDYQGAIAAFKVAAAVDPLNRLPWVEISKIQKTHLGDAKAAILTIRHALESQEWEINDAAYFLFRLAELYDEVEGDRAAAVSIMDLVVAQFPGTRHSANASHKLHEWILADAAVKAAAVEGEKTGNLVRAAQSLADEEAEYLARMQKVADKGNSHPPV
jgi:tetratricopeptide (TPR) repeat protein